MLAGGKRAVLIGGKPAILNANGECPACCGSDKFTMAWTFADHGYIDGGQDGAWRFYDDPSDVAASPWGISGDGLSLTVDFEDDYNCLHHNPYAQRATATCTIHMPKPMIMTADWSGMGENNYPYGERMTIDISGSPVGSGLAPGGFKGCAGGMGPIVSSPAPPQQKRLRADDYTLHIDVFTTDEFCHHGPWYQFNFTFELDD